MESIYEYISETLLVPTVAAKQYNRIADAILTLEQMPKRIKLMNSEPERSKGFRSLIVDNYIVIFVIKTSTVNIVRVLYGASDIRKQLMTKVIDFP